MRAAPLVGHDEHVSSAPSSALGIGYDEPSALVPHVVLAAAVAHVRAAFCQVLAHARAARSGPVTGTTRSAASIQATAAGSSVLSR